MPTPTTPAVEAAFQRLMSQPCAVLDKAAIFRAGVAFGSANPKPLTECKREDLADHHHALVYGRVRVWNRGGDDNNELRSHWSKTAWWKAMWYPHRGPPSGSGTWGIYAGASDGYTGPGDAELTHFLPMPSIPVEAARAALKNHGGTA